MIDNADIDDMLSMVYEEMELTLRDMPFSKARDMIEMKKCVFVAGVLSGYDRDADLHTLRKIPQGEQCGGHHFLRIPLSGEKMLCPRLQ